MYNMILFQTMQINNASFSQDFNNQEDTGMFGANDNAVKQCSFGIKDDALPEGNETFTVTLAKFGNNVAVGNPKDATITILANDMAYGVIGFSQSGTVDLQEPTSSLSTHQIQLSRLIGSYGAVSVTWEFVSGPDKGTKDLVKTSGTVSFAEGQQVASLSLQVKPDNIPENAEVFTLRLTSVQGGAQLNSSFSDLQIRIPANDAPIRFPVTYITVPENLTTIQVQVFRGLQSDGITTVGNIQETVAVNWFVLPGNARPGKDFQDKNGTITFASGVTKVFININIINDNTPELAENFSIRIETASQSVYIIPTGVATVTILPNDDQHGVFSFGHFPKYLDEDGVNTGSFKVNRSAGTFGSASVSWTMVANNGASLAAVFEKTSGVLNFSAGESLKTISVVVRQDQIPEEAAEYYIELSSPTGGSRLGNTLEARRAVFYVKDSDSAYGVVEFAGQNQQKIVQDTSPRRLSLTLTRNGGTLRSISVNNTVEYYLPKSNVPSNSLGFAPNGEVTFTAGQVNKTITVTIPDDGFIKLGSAFKVLLNKAYLVGGQNAVNLTLNIYTDSIPELSEVFVVTLSNASSPNKLQTGMETATITIAKNDNPGGTFVFKNTTSLVLKEGGIISFDVIRRGSALDERKVGFKITPDGGADFIGSTGYITFKPSVLQQSKLIFVKIDGIPELEEKFQLVLVPFGPEATQGTLGNEKVINVTISENDDPYGIIEFASADLVKRIDEKKGRNTTVTFTVERQKGTFGSTNVSWVVLGGKRPGLDLHPTQGVLRFSSSDSSKTIAVQVLHDVIPETNETFIIHLQSKTGKALFGAHLNATLTISKNDDPVYFDAPTHVNVSEGQTANLTVRRGGDGLGSIIVTYSTFDGTAHASDSDYVPIVGRVAFGVGEFFKRITITIPDDDKPEGVEYLTVKLITATGDTVIQNDVAMVTIYASDAGTGVFHFAESSLNKTVSETGVINFEVLRSIASHGKVRLFWQLLRLQSDGSLTELPSGVDFVPSSGHLDFADGVGKETITIRPFNDDIAEMNETFAVRIVNATGIATGEDGRLGNVTVAYFTVLPSDDPYGVFRFDTSSVDLKIPEDYLPGQKNSTEKNLTVIRNQGAWGYVQVLWEVSTAQGSIKQPPQFDVLFLGSTGSGVVNEPSKKRENTGTNVSCFSSTRSGSYATVSLFGGESLNEMSISSWLLPERQSLGYFLSYAISGVVNMAVAVNTTGSTSTVFLSLFNSNVNIFMISII
ncbi:hypothetical protein QZH41_015002 [Actinostola sp. cb2023]|nr:hypothetical protein QZH41_015002 [Actinostola sp. cb2023]